MQDANDGTPGQGAALRWAEQYGVEHPVLADAEGATNPFVTQGYPTYPVINPDMIIINEDLYPFNPSTVGQYIMDGM